MSGWECVIGLEVHVQLATKSKMFSGAATDVGAEPNAHACLIDVALPGVLPVCNIEAVGMAIKFGLAVGATINRRSIFARKNYFYPDLPKGYQISQYEIPIVSGGTVATLVDGISRPVRLTRAHLEEDAGKSLHEEFGDATGIDLNRAGTPLLEIVSEPEICSSAQAADYLRRLHALVTSLGICDGNLQDGSMRCDANISVRRKGDDRLGTRTELKNINSFRFVEKGIDFEMRRQIDVLENGGTVVQETRQYDSQKDQTRAMRGKESAHDYRYFPDPDLPPLVLSAEFIEAMKAQLPELPEAKRSRFMEQYRLGDADAAQLASSTDTAAYFESAVLEAPDNPKGVANWIIGELAGYLNRGNLEISDSPISPKILGQLVAKIDDGKISGKNAKTLFALLWENPAAELDELIREKGLEHTADASEVARFVTDTLASSPKQVEQYLGGNRKMMGYFVGQVMKSSHGKLDPKQVNEEVERQLAKKSGTN